MLLEKSKIIGALFLMASFSALCNQSKEMSLEDKVNKSDLVVIARVVSVFKKGCVASSKCADIRIATYLKGSSVEQVAVLFDGPISELNPKCCVPGATYLFLLEHIDERYYRSVNGRYGVYLIRKR
jgi:hypothetical protein